MELRPYQRKAVEKTFEEWSIGHTKTLYVAGTGTGKTIVMAEVVRALLSKGECQQMIDEIRVNYHT